MFKCNCKKLVPYLNYVCFYAAGALKSSLPLNCEPYTVGIRVRLHSVVITTFIVHAGDSNLARLVLIKDFAWHNIYYVSQSHDNISYSYF